MDNPNAGNAEALPGLYAAWRERMLAAAITATAVGFVAHGSAVDIRYESDDALPSTGLILGLVVLVVAAVAPGLVGTGFALAAVGSWRRLGRSIRFARAAWVARVLGPLPILLVPLAHVFSLDGPDAVVTSANQVRYLLLVMAPALLALLPGVLSACLVVKHFLPESRAPGQITLVVAPFCIVGYLIPLGVVAQLGFRSDLYFGLLAFVGYPAVTLLAARQLVRRTSPDQMARPLRIIRMVRTGLAVLGASLGILAGKWLTTVVVTDLLIGMMHQSYREIVSEVGVVEKEVLARKLDILGTACQPEPLGILSTGWSQSSGRSSGRSPSTTGR